MRSRLRFLMELVLDYNENHTDTRAVFRLDQCQIDVFIEDKNGRDKMIDVRYFGDLTEEAVYEIYKKMKKSTADDDAPKMDVTEK